MSVESPTEPALPPEDIAAPERRRVSVSYADLSGFVAMSEAFTPEEVEETMNAFLEETVRGIEVHGGTADRLAGTSVTAFFGAPRPARDHAWKAIRSACDQIAFLRERREDFHAKGKLLPECSVAVHTGEMVLGHTGPGGRRSFTALGPAVTLAERITRGARPGEVLVTGATLTAALADLPGNWQVAETTENTPETRPTNDAVPLPADLRGRVVLVGPNVVVSPETATFRFRYRHTLPRRGVEAPLAVLAVDRPDQAGAHPYAEIHNLALTSQDRVVGRYHLLEVVGRGGMAEVWRARDNSGAVVAIKILRGGIDASDHSLRRLKREAEIMQRLSHRHVCGIREIGFHDGVTFIAMEFVEGATLSAVLSAAGDSTSLPTAGADVSAGLPSVIARASRMRPGTAARDESATVARPKPRAEAATLPVQQSLAILIQVCAAIHYAHEHGVLHRDLKPGNILIRPNGEPVVTDFGLGKIRDAWTTARFPSTSRCSAPSNTWPPSRPARARTPTSAPTSIPSARSFTRCSPGGDPSSPAAACSPTSSAFPRTSPRRSASTRRSSTPTSRPSPSKPCATIPPPATATPPHCGKTSNATSAASPSSRAPPRSGRCCGKTCADSGGGRVRRRLRGGWRRSARHA